MAFAWLPFDRLLDSGFWISIVALHSVGRVVLLLAGIVLATPACTTMLLYCVAFLWISVEIRCQSYHP
jgi:hypothetical protein